MKTNEKQNVQHYLSTQKIGGVKIDTRKRTIYYLYQNPASEAKMNRKAVCRLCKDFGFARQAEII